MSDFSNLSKKDRQELLKGEEAIKQEVVRSGDIDETVETTNVLATIKASQLIDVSSWREKQKKLLAENPFFEIVDNKTYEAGKKHRTNVVKGRTELQNQDKLVASTFASIRKEVGSETAVLIEITQPLEDQWQEEVKSWEDRKAKEKEAAEQAEALRIKTINDKIEEIETSCYEIIQKMVFSEIDLSKTQLFAFFTIEFDFEEYDILFEQVKSRVELALDSKVASLTASENQRLDNIRLEEANKEAKRLSDLQASRLTEIMPYVAFGDVVDLTNLSSLEDNVFQAILIAKKEYFQLDQKKKQKEEQERLAKEEEEKEAIYAIREKRLLELGMQYSDEHDTFWLKENDDYILLKDDVIDWSALEFEETFSEVKNIIQEANDKIEKEKVFEIRKNRLAEIGFNVDEERSGFFIHPLLFGGVDTDALFNLDATWFENKISESKLNIEKAKLDAEEAEKQKSIDLQLAIEDAERLKAENKARVKKYSKDKKALTDFVKSLEFRSAVPELENDDMQPVLDKILLELENSRGYLLTQINLF